MICGLCPSLDEIVRWIYPFFLRLSQGISPGCHHATPYTIVWNCHCGKGTWFCFDLAKVFLQGATMPPLHPFFVIVIVVRWIMLPLPLSQGISSGCYHATPTLFLELSLWEGALCFCFDLARGFLQGATMSTIPNFFFGFFVVWRGIMLLFWLSQVIFQVATMPILHPRNCFLELSLWKGGMLLRLS